MRPNRVSRRSLLAATAGMVGVGGIRTEGKRGTNHVVVFGGSPDTIIEYGLTVSGRLRKSGRSGGAPIADRHVTEDDEDRISGGGTHASGAVAGGGDAYRYTGRIVRFRVSPSSGRAGELNVYRNGRRVRPDELGDNPAAETPIEFVNCDTARVTGNFRSVRMHTSFWDESGLGTNVLFQGPVSGTTTIHPAAAHDHYPFAIDTLSVDTRELRTPGQPAKFTADNPYAGPWCRERGLPNHLVVFGGSPRNVVQYRFAVSGKVRKSGRSGGAPIADRHVTKDDEDTITGKRVRGAVAGGGDAYRFSGELRRFRMDGDATVYLNGREIKPDGGGGDGGDGEEPTRRIEFLDCDRARVTGAFERVAISTTWYASDGVATSYNEIGPVSGRTRIDESNVGDVAGVSGFVITDVAAFESGAAEPTISKRNPNLKACLRRVRPEKVSASAEGCTATDDGGTVTFVYRNPNDEALLVRSELVGASSTAPPDELRPGRHSFTARWNPTSPDERLRWRLDMRPFGYENQITATGPTAAECGVTTGAETTGQTTDRTTEATAEGTTERSEPTTDSAGTTAEPATEESEPSGNPESTTEDVPATTETPSETT
ncbi:hypothetical protein [Haladaptatus salinisoli]|uniref:hypothetical protein n=1 Tax=Haladaptatus salinisoli TaxID=2884876 RepID=UPI001D0ABB84|nr:hypothetical protein [Haladaptatus salinisoli]